MTGITIIGGGPAGCKAASLLNGSDVTIIEEHKVSGTPVQCTGLISDDVVKLSGTDVNVLNSLYGANVHFPNGGIMTARSKERKAVLIDRFEFDRNMAYAAEDSGAVFRYGVKYLSHKISSDVKITTTDGTFSSDIIIGADGHSSAVARSLGNNEPKEYVKGIQADIKNTMDDTGMIDIFIGSDAPKFFAWLIPFEDMTRVGLCSSGDLPPSEYFKNLLKKTGLQDKPVVKKYSGKIPLGGRRVTYGERTLLIGDAAGQVKPISGGGLYPAFRSSYPLADTVKEAFASDDMSSAFLKRYEKRWRSEVGKELRNGYVLRKMFKRMDDRALNDIFCAVDSENTRRILNDIEIDNPSDVVRPMMKNIPMMMKCSSAILRGMIR